MNYQDVTFCSSANLLNPNPRIETFLHKSSSKDKRKILKAFLIASLYKIMGDSLFEKTGYGGDDYLECYLMDRKIIQLFIHEIIATNEYTLEGIAYQTRIPYDVIYEAASGINGEFSIILWARIITLYIEVKPEVAEKLIDNFLEMKIKNAAELSVLLSDG
jgi:hypothetical protein